MSKVQSYIYIAVILLALLGVAVVWNARKVNQQPIASPQPSISATPEVAIKYNSDGSINTSNWLTFRHEVYPYEIKYPEKLSIHLNNDYKEDGTENSDKSDLTIVIRKAEVGLGFSLTADVAGKNTIIDDFFRLDKYTAKDREYSMSPYAGGHMVKKVDEVEKVSGINWEGYQYSFTQGYDNNSPEWQTTKLFIVHKRVLYKVFYDKTFLVHQVILDTLKFID